MLTERLLRRNRRIRTVYVMRENEANQQHLLLVVEAAQRAGYSEAEVAAIVEDAAEADAELDAAA